MYKWELVNHHFYYDNSSTGGKYKTVPSLLPPQLVLSLTAYERQVSQKGTSSETHPPGFICQVQAPAL